MDKKTILKNIFKYALPTVLSMWIFTLYTMIDGIFVGRFIGVTALAGVNLALPLINLIFSISIMIAVGSSTLISIKFGENNYEEGNKIFTIAIFFNLLISILITIFISINITKISHLLGAYGGILNYTKDYLKIIILFCPFFMLGYSLEIYIKVDANPKYPMFCVLIGGISNLVLDYFLVVIFHFGIKGAATATGISQLITCTMLFSYLKFKKNHIKFYKIKFSEIHKILPVIKIGFPEFLTEVTSGLSILIYNIIISKKIGDTGLAIFGVICYISSFTTMTMIGFSQGIQPIISYNLGKKNFKILKIIMKISTFSIFCLGVIFLIVSYNFSSSISSAFFKNNFMIDKASKIIRIYNSSYVFLGLNIFISSFLTATKKTSQSILIIFMRAIFLNIIFLSLLPKFWGSFAIWISPLLCESITSFLSFYFYLKILNEQDN